MIPAPSSPLPLIPRFGVFVAMVAALLAVGEEFPFSNFPMYSVLPDSVHFIRVTDDAGKMLPLVPSFGVTSSVLKKQMERELRAMKQAGEIERLASVPVEFEKKAGQQVLDWMLKHHAPLKSALTNQIVKLERHGFRFEQGLVIETADVLAEGRAQASLPTSP